MDENIYTVILSDDTRLENIHLLETGQYYTSEDLDESLFSLDNLSIVTIELGDLQETLYEQICDVFYKDGGNTYFQLRELNELERIKLEYQSKLDYLAAMTGVDLDE